MSLVPADLRRDAGAGAADELGDSSALGIDDRQARRHRFKDDGRTRIVVLGVQQKMGPAIDRRRLGLRVGPQKLNGLPDAQLAARRSTSARGVRSEFQRSCPLIRSRASGVPAPDQRQHLQRGRHAIPRVLRPAQQHRQRRAGVERCGRKRVVSTAL